MSRLAVLNSSTFVEPTRSPPCGSGGGKSGVGGSSSSSSGAASCRPPSTAHFPAVSIDPLSVSQSSSNSSSSCSSPIAANPCAPSPELVSTSSDNPSEGKSEMNQNRSIASKSSPPDPGASDTIPSTVGNLGNQLGKVPDNSSNRRVGDGNDDIAISLHPSNDDLNETKPAARTEGTGDGSMGKTAEDLIQEELGQLSDVERIRIMQDVQGESLDPSLSSHNNSRRTISMMPNESIIPHGTLPASLHALHHEMQQLMSHPDNADIVNFTMSEYAQDSGLRKQMLLAECNNANAAARRLIGYLRLLQDILGANATKARPITLADLSEKERHLQRKGRMQLFKFRDTHGRRVVGCFETGTAASSSGTEFSSTSQLKVLTYLMHAAAEDEASQEKGIVVIFMLGKSTIDGASQGKSTFDLRSQALIRVLQHVPVRIGAFHVCSPDQPEFHSVNTNIVNSLNRNERLRTRLHRGTTMECSSALTKFGIPTDRLPLKYDGSIKLEDHLQWIAVREAREDAYRHGKPFNVIECPLNMDILAGRGQLIRSHPGNVSFRQDFIHVRMADYNKAFNREAKNDVANRVLEDISSLKRRFLKQHATAAYWTELDYKTAKEKVMMAFREYRKVQKSNAAAVAAPNAADGSAQQTSPGRAGRSIAPMVAEGFRRPVPSPISVSRSNSNMTPPIERQLQNPSIHQAHTPQGPYPDHNVQSQMAVGPPHPGAFFPYHAVDPRTGRFYPPPHPPQVPPPQRGYPNYEPQSHIGHPPAHHPPPNMPPGSFHPSNLEAQGQSQGDRSRNYSDHNHDPFDDYCHQG